MIFKYYKYIIGLGLITFLGSLYEGLDVASAAIVAIYGPISIVSAFYLTKLFFGDKEFGIGHYVIWVIVMSISALLILGSIGK